MRHLSFDDLRENYLFDYKDGDLLVIDDIRRLRLVTICTLRWRLLW